MIQGGVHTAPVNESAVTMLALMGRTVNLAVAITEHDHVLRSVAAVSLCLPMHFFQMGGDYMATTAFEFLPLVASYTWSVQSNNRTELPVQTAETSLQQDSSTATLRCHGVPVHAKLHRSRSSRLPLHPTKVPAARFGPGTEFKSSHLKP